MAFDTIKKHNFKPDLENAAKGVVNDLFVANTTIKDLRYKYQQGVGTGFKKNLWTMDFRFSDEILTGINNYTFMLPNDRKPSYTESKASPSGNVDLPTVFSTTTNIKKSTVFMLAKSCNIPGVSFEQNKITKHIKYIRPMKKMRGFLSGTPTKRFTSASWRA